MPGVFDDQATLQRIYQNSLSPIETMGQNALSMALANRVEQSRMAQQRQEQEFQIEREKIQNQAMMEREKVANQAVTDRIIMEHNLLTKEEQEKQRKMMIQKANEVGSELPSDASFETASRAYVSAKGKSYVEANKRMGALVGRAMNVSGMDAKETSERIANMIADDPGVAKALTIAEREKIRSSPTELASLRKQFSTDKKKYEAFTQAQTAASQLVLADIEKQAASKPEAIRVAADLRVASDTIKALQKDYSFSPQVEAEAFQAYSDAAKPPPPPGPPQRNFTLPGSRVAPGPAGASAQPQAPPMSGAQFGVAGQMNTPPTVQSPFTPGTVNNLPGFVPWSVTNPTSATPVNPTPGVPTDPSILSTLRLRKFLQDSAGTNSTLFPTAYPPAQNLMAPNAGVPP